MRRPLGTVLPAVLLTGLLGSLVTGCGDDGSTVSDDPAGPSTPASSSGAPTSPPPSGKPTSGEPVDFELVTTVTETGAGGHVSPQAVPLADDTAVQQFVAPFTDPLQAAVQQAVDGTGAADDQRLYGAVVAVGCDAPHQVEVVAADSGLLVVAQPVANPKPECFAPMTTVALVLVPAAAVE